MKIPRRCRSTADKRSNLTAIHKQQRRCHHQVKAALREQERQYIRGAQVLELFGAARIPRCWPIMLRFDDLTMSGLEEIKLR